MRQVLKDIKLRIPPGQFVAVVGRSACDKSTLLLRLLAGNGALAATGYDARLKFQEARRLPWKWVIDNVALGLNGDW